MNERTFKKKLKSELGIRPGRTSLYQEALRHRSILEEADKRFSYERLEFLGDAILDAVISEHLYAHYPAEEEGFLTRMRSKLVSRERLNRMAEELGVLDLLEHNVNLVKEEGSGIGGDALEALVGAVYLDKGYKKTRNWILRTFIGPIDIERLQQVETDFKSRLIEWGQKNDKRIRFRSLPSDENAHHVALFVNDEEVARGSGRTKKKGEQIAAQRFLEGKKGSEASFKKA